MKAGKRSSKAKAFCCGMRLRLCLAVSLWFNSADLKTMNERLGAIRHIALDLDGTIYRGGTVFKSTVPFLELLGRLGIGHTFLTNNPSRSDADYLAHLRHLGVPARPEQVCTSVHATLEFLRGKW